MFGADSRRVVKIAAHRLPSDLPPLVGSGYRVTESAVLTARHVLGDVPPDRIAVQSRAGGWRSGVVSCRDLGDDVALLEIGPTVVDAGRLDLGTGVPVDPPTYGHLDRSPGEMLAVTIGYPSSALKRTEADLTVETQPFRDLAETHGRIASLSGLDQGTFRFDIDTFDWAVGESAIGREASPGGWTGEQPAPQSDWAGMSGAALWVNDVLVGVITADGTERGPQRLIATRLDHVLRRLERDDPTDAQDARRALGLLPGEALADAAFNADYVLDADEFERLSSILTEALAMPPLPRIFRESTGYRLDLPADAEDVLANVGVLRRFVPATPLFRFLVRFAAETTDEDASLRLNKWIDLTARRWRVDPDDLRAEREKARPLVLSVQLEPSEVASGWHVTAWLYTGRSENKVAAPDDEWDHESLREWLGEQICALVGEFDPDRDTAPLTVEFRVDTDTLEEELECIPVTIGGQRYQLGEVCPVLMRSLERLQREEWRDSWAQQWGRLCRVGHTYNPDIIHWVDNPGPLRAEPAHVVAALAYTGQRSEWLATLNAIVEAGTPVAIWHRGPGKVGRRAALERILGNVGLSDVPRRVRRQRIAAARSPGRDHIGRNLVLLWDDADRIPEPYELQAPAWEGGES